MLTPFATNLISIQRRSAKCNINSTTHESASINFSDEHIRHTDAIPTTVPTTNTFRQRRTIIPTDRCIVATVSTVMIPVKTARTHLERKSTKQRSKLNQRNYCGKSVSLSNVNKINLYVSWTSVKRHSRLSVLGSRDRAF